MPPFCPYLTQLVTDSIARFRAQLSLDKDSSFPSTASTSVASIMPPFCPYLTQLVTDSIAQFRAQLSLDKDSSFPSTASTSVASIMPPFCPYLTQLVTDSIARFRAQLSLDKDSSFCVLSTHTFVAMKYSSPLFIPSHPPFPKDLTADGDIESNPGPVTQEAINSVYPNQWVDDEAIVEYCKVIFQQAGLDFESMFIHPTTWLQYIVSPDVPLDQWLLTKIQRNQRTNSKYLFVPLSDTMTRNANYSREGVTGSIGV
ncbi:hypothetical protein GEMRC1_006629 [Eukaryota sp. GEM-RC1]